MTSHNQTANPTYAPVPYSPLGYRSFREFYPFYLGEHSHPVCRRLHFVGTTIGIVCQLRVLLSIIPSILLHVKGGRFSAKLARLRLDGGRKSQLRLAIFALLQAYVWSWTGHFFFEGNKPAAFAHPFYSLLGDLTFWKEVMLVQRDL